MDNTTGVNERLAGGSFIIPPPAEVDRVEKIKRPDALAIALAEFGIASVFIEPIPPETGEGRMTGTVGWRSYLNGIWHWEYEARHDTIFDNEFRLRWLRIESGKRVPLTNLQKPTTYNC